MKQDEGFDEEKDLYEAFNMFDLNGTYVFCNEVIGTSNIKHWLS